MTTKYVEEFVKTMLNRGFSIDTIKHSYLSVLKTDDDLIEILNYLSKNKTSSKEDVNYEIHRIHLKKRGISI